MRKHYERYECRQSVASLEATLKAGPGTFQVSTGDLSVVLGTNVYEGQNCIQAWAEFGAGTLVELLNAVRNRTLDFALALWKEYPTAGEPGNQSSPVVKSSTVTQIFNTTVYGGSASLVGAAHNSSLTFNVTTNDFASLERVLKQSGLSGGDVEDLRRAIDEDAKPVTKGKLGPKVSSWFAKTMQKAADGTWAIGIATAGELLSHAIEKYYGF